MLGGRSTVGHVALDHVIGVRIPASQPDFARLRRASSGPASGWPYPSESPSGEVCPAEAASEASVWRRRTTAFLAILPQPLSRRRCTLHFALASISERLHL